MNLKSYKFSESELGQFEEEFIILLENVDLNDLNIKAYQETLKDYTFGVYFWVLTVNDEKYKIYVGKTNSISRRIKDYSINFQIHSPNDYKMRFFQNFIQKNFNQYLLSLYFSPENKDAYTKKETESIRLYRPMINQRYVVSAEEKRFMQQVFESYYESIFSGKLEN